MVKIWIHSNIAKLANCKTDWEAVGNQRCIGAILKTTFADDKNLLFGIIDETNSVRKHINIYIGSDNIRQINGLDSEINDGDEISIFTAISGG